MTPGWHIATPRRKVRLERVGGIACERGREGPAYIQGRELLAVGDSPMAFFQEGYLMQWNAMPWLGTAKWCMFDCGEVNGTVTRDAMGIPRRQSNSPLAL